eukprot:CAMPEP_0182422252 /NCGR_PEP_ID=MMETSP1167-20130531/7888_1 /TAXON_ID=2988 /ORGANISM="Mallomonas Sp, Strain CCMP3275" /LENGTH=458 /DNA_ID=CAMNT_0024600147 /DNA_START=18 /DNA_END=1395 /DNA_ORIENTATION=+
MVFPMPQIPPEALEQFSEKTRTKFESIPFEHMSEKTRAKFQNIVPQSAPGAHAAVGHTIENSIPLSIFPIQPDKFCICFCGLPGRGKTHISRRLARYLSFFHAIPTKVFNSQEYRRRICGTLHDAEWFDPSNKEARELRRRCNSEAISDMVDFLNSNTNAVVILDSTNPTHERRRILFEKMTMAHTKVVFIEVSCDNLDFLAEQFKAVAHTSPDYANVNDVDAEADYSRRVDKYASFFEPIDERHDLESKWSFFKCDHSRENFVVHKVRGYLPLKVVNFIMNMQIKTHGFYLSRHGQSEYNLLGRIGGDSGLSEHGLGYARKLAEYVDTHITHDESGAQRPARLWTSSMKRTKETAQFIKSEKILLRDPDGAVHEWDQMRGRAWHHMDELFAGECDGMTYKEIEEKYPEEWVRRQVDKLAYRYPRGESYLDVIARLEPMIIEMERQKEPVLIKLIKAY